MKSVAMPRPRSASVGSAASLRQRGNALVFAMLGLVIGGIVLALGIGYYQRAQVDAQSQSTISEIGAIVGAAQQNFGQYGYVGLTTAIAVGSRVIPEVRADANGTSATNAYSGAITLVDNSSSTAGTAMLSYTNVPTSQCAQLVNATQGLAREITVGSSLVKPLDGTVDVVQLNAQCVASNAVTIHLVFGRT